MIDATSTSTHGTSRRRAIRTLATFMAGSPLLAPALLPAMPDRLRRRVVRARPVRPAGHAGQPGRQGGADAATGLT